MTTLSSEVRAVSYTHLESLKNYLETSDYTDLLFLYNASGFAEDVSLAKLLS